MYGTIVEDHDRNLENVITRLQERNLTLNPNKCSFRMDKMIFMGILLSKYGIGPTDERVEAVFDFGTTAELLRKVAR